MVYADYKYYSEEYLGTLPENSFKSLIIKSSREIDKNVNTDLTQDLITCLSEKAQEQLKDTACALVDLINKKEESKNRKLSSFSIDGVSKIFNLISDAEYNSSKREIIECLPDELTKYL